MASSHPSEPNECQAAGRHLGLTEVRQGPTFWNRVTVGWGCTVCGWTRPVPYDGPALKEPVYAGRRKRRRT